MIEQMGIRRPSNSYSRGRRRDTITTILLPPRQESESDGRNEDLCHRAAPRPADDASGTAQVVSTNVDRVPGVSKFE